MCIMRNITYLILNIKNKYVYPSPMGGWKQIAHLHLWQALLCRQLAPSIPNHSLKNIPSKTDSELDCAINFTCAKGTFCMHKEANI